MRQSYSRQAGRSGFTMVELMVVIVIVAVFVSLTFVLVNRGKRAAKTAGSINNLRQIHTLMMGYVGDHHSRFPISVYQEEPSSPTWRRKIWENAHGDFEGSPPEVMEAMQNSGYERVMWCPLMVSEHGQDQHPEGRGSYSINRFFMPPAWGGGDRRASQSEVIGQREPYIMTGKPFEGRPEFGTFYHLDSAKFPYDTHWSNLHYAYGSSGENALGLFIGGHVENISKAQGEKLHELLRDPAALE
ncbi:prepilin-type N-terminal cleavage/methylation domain-containing protein [Haloferula sp.]|uniref:prepilin-type N-terminal cleavage/methylation domain-containing protein n=1 Tax=Haloferula sp. TaxID=2497595 RepID=UPI003C70DDD0